MAEGLQFIVKLGGAAITHKNQFEELNTAVLKDTCAQIAEATGSNNCKPFIIVHGAGSFGHFQAKQHKVAEGGLNETPKVKSGFVATRISVKKLNGEVVQCLSNHGVPAIGISPFGEWTTNQKKLHSCRLDSIEETLKAGMVPVLHGDAVIDRMQGCAILSGDVILRHLAAVLKPSLVIFLTNVDGVFDRPPEDPKAMLIKRIEVQKGGSWNVVEPPMLGIATSKAAHDTTGGMAAKVEEAVSIARFGIPVVIAKAGSSSAYLALKTAAAWPTAAGVASVDNIAKGINDWEDWRGTLVCSSE